jgi:tetratricopeptide (TPR) repeat protein
MIALRYQGSALRHQSRFDEAIAAHSRGLNIAMSVCDTLEIISALNNIGTDYRREGDLSKANGFHYKALSYSNAYSDHISPEAVKAWVMALNGIGNIEIELRHYASADSVLRLALQGERSLGSDLGMAINYSNLGAIKRALGEADSAWAYYGESLKHNQLAGSQLGVALCHLNYGELYADERNFSRAQVEYKQAYQLLKEQGDAYHWLESCLSLASVSMMLGEKEEALQYVQDAEAEALRINSKEHQARAYHIFYELALLGGDTRSALDFYIKSDALYDSIYGLEKSN